MEMPSENLWRWLVIRYIGMMAILGGFAAAHTLVHAPFFSVILPGGGAICFFVFLIMKIAGVRQSKRREKEKIVSAIRRLTRRYRAGAPPR